MFRVRIEVVVGMNWTYKVKAISEIKLTRIYDHLFG